MSVRHHHLRVLLGQAEHQVELAVQEGQPARLALLDDADLDRVDHRQPPALEAREQSLTLGVVGIGLRLVDHLAETGVAHQPDQRAASPAVQHEGPRADGVLHDAVPVVLDHLARHRAVGVAAGEVVEEARPRPLQLELQRVAVQCAHALDRLVVVERALVLERVVAQRLQAQDALLAEGRVQRALHRRVVEALERVDVVLGHQLAPPALEGRVIGEVGAGLEPDGPGAEVLGDLRHRRGRVGLELEGPRQVVVVVERVEDVGGDDARVQIAQLRRIEAGLRDQEGVAQDLLGRRRRRPGCRGCRLSDRRGGAHGQRGGEEGAACVQCAAFAKVGSMSTYSHQFCQNTVRR